VVRGDCLFQVRGSALMLAEGNERGPEPVLGRGPVERRAFARDKGQQDLISVDRLAQSLVVAALVTPAIKRISFLLKMTQHTIVALLCNLFRRST